MLHGKPGVQAAAVTLHGDRAGLGPGEPEGRVWGAVAGLGVVSNRWPREEVPGKPTPDVPFGPASSGARLGSDVPGSSALTQGALGRRDGQLDGAAAGGREEGHFARAGLPSSGPRAVCTSGHLASATLRSGRGPQGGVAGLTALCGGL